MTGRRKGRDYWRDHYHYIIISCEGQRTPTALLAVKRRVFDCRAIEAGQVGKKLLNQRMDRLGRACQAHLRKPVFTPWMQQRRNFDAHVFEYAALKIPALPFQAAKCVFCKLAQHPHIASASAPASLRKATSRPSLDGGYPLLLVIYLLSHG